MWIDCPLAVPLPGRTAGQITGLFGLFAWDSMGYHGIKGGVKQKPKKTGQLAGTTAGLIAPSACVSQEQIENDRIVIRHGK
jgi:hypothetical protein